MGEERRGKRKLDNNCNELQAMCVMMFFLSPSVELCVRVDTYFFSLCHSLSYGIGSRATAAPRITTPHHPLSFAGFSFRVLPSQSFV